MTLRAKYWTLQILGWGLYSATGLAITVYFGGWRSELIVAYLLFFLYSIGLTEAFRGVIVRGRWLDAPTRWLGLRLVAGTLLIAAIQFALVISIDMLLEPWTGMWHWPAALSLAWGTVTVTGIWTVLYIRLTETRRVHEREVGMQLALREAELRALQQQVNPHFLFNCLNSIRALVVEDPRRAQEMVTRLANMLRYSLARQMRDTVPLASEVEIVRDYLALEAVRFEERLRVRLDVDQAVAAAEVPPMLLTTLVENAVKHGIAPAASGGAIEIRAAREGTTVRIDVANTGGLREPAPDAVGLANVRERLRLLYGDAASVTLGSGSAGMVQATVTIPLAS
jgi:hypothetical protein